jgi:hypothetical protein
LIERNIGGSYVGSGLVGDIIILLGMPGSYRGLGMMMEKNRKEKVKSDDENVSESVESELGQNREGTDGKWDV